MNRRCRYGLLEQRIETTSKVVSILIGWAARIFLAPPTRRWRSNSPLSGAFTRRSTDIRQKNNITIR
jgi:hypothetical protein